MDAVSLISEWKRRLIALADSPDHVFRDTPAELIEQHYQKLTTFVGFSEAEVAAVEGRLSIRFPSVFRCFLLEMGRSPGSLFCGSDLADITEFEQFRTDASAMLSDTDPACELPDNAVVFLFHQGYTCLSIDACGGIESPILQWTETEPEPVPVADAFAELIDAELRLKEEHNRRSREMGGCFLTLHAGGGQSIEYPSTGSGERPLDSA